MTGPRPSSPEHARSSSNALRAAVRHFVEFFQWQFSQAPVGAYRWVDDENDSEIHISGDSPIIPTKVGQRPAITVLRAHAAWSGTGINDQVFVDLRTGAKAYMDLVPTTIMVNVLSRLDVEAEELAEFCAGRVRVFREAIVGASNGLILYTGQRIAISPPSPPGSLVGGDSPDGEWSVCVVSVPTYLQTLDSRWPLNKPILRTFGARLRTLAAARRAEATVPLQGTAVSQPAVSPTPPSGVGADLPRTTQSEAPSTEPLEVKIKA